VKRKLERFKEIETLPNVIEPSKENYHYVRGKWNEDFFKNENPITIELACGRGEYTVGLARLFPNNNYIGVDIKGERIWKGSSQAQQEGLTNVGFLRTMILLIENFFDEKEVNEIWITFPDPRPRKRDIKRRLTSPRFLSMYKRMLKPGGYVRLKTDNTGLYEYSLEELQNRNDIDDLQFTDDVYNSPLRPECFDIKTRFEQQFASKGEKIKYLRFRFKD
jgi:tRNA (guanine-N7-)-methyltransferase